MTRCITPIALFTKVDAQCDKRVTANDSQIARPILAQAAWRRRGLLPNYIRGSLYSSYSHATWRVALRLRVSSGLSLGTLFHA